MAMSIDGARPVLFAPRPGIRRDGPALNLDTFTDGQWVRFNGFGRPRKIGGCRTISENQKGPVYGTHMFFTSDKVVLHTGSATAVEAQQFDNETYSPASGVSDRTPVGFTTDPGNTWTFDIIYDGSGANSVILAHAAPNALSITNTESRNVYYGVSTAATALTNTGATAVSGGVVCLHPFVFVFGNDGFVQWSDTNAPGTWAGGSSGSARVSEGKIVAGLSARAGTNVAPAGLFWSTSSLIRATFAGGTTVFNFDTISDAVDILAYRGPVEYDGTFYWPGVERFLMYNGIVQELPNNVNVQWFYENLNWTYRNKVWGTRVPRWGEIWWFFPKGEATECNHAIIFNVRLSRQLGFPVWYDTPVPDIRTSGAFAEAAPYPIYTGEKATGLSTYTIQQHEFGYDRIAGGQTLALRSSFTGPFMALSQAGVAANVRLTRIELDMTQSGQMTATALQRKAPRLADASSSQTFLPATDYLDRLRLNAHYLRLKMESNSQGGFYEVGDIYFLLNVADSRPAGA